MSEPTADKRKPGRPRGPARTSTAIRLREDLHEALTVAAVERDLSVNWLVNRAVADFLPRLVPVDELVIARPHSVRTETSETGGVQ